MASYGFIKLCYGVVGSYKDTSKMTEDEVVKEFLKHEGVSSADEYYEKCNSNTYGKLKQEMLAKQAQSEGIDKNTSTDDSDARRSKHYQFADENSDILSMIDKVGNGNFKANEKVYLGVVADSTATEIGRLTGVNVNGFKVAIEARQIEHILKDHGKNGKTDRSMANPSDIAKIEYALENYDDITRSGKTQAYTHMVNGKNRTVDTILYEKSIGEKSYYVVQAVPDTNAKTLYIVTAFIGKKGYKKEV